MTVDDFSSLFGVFFVAWTLGYGAGHLFRIYRQAMD